MSRTTVEILDSSLNVICEVRSLVPLNKNGMVLRYSKEMDNFGFCYFRISTHDPLFTTYGDIVTPHQYHVRIKRDQKTIWSGAIVDNTQRNKSFVEIKGAEYEFYLNHVLIKRTSKVGYGEVAPTADIGLHYRIFSSGTMASAVSSIISETKTKLGSNHLMGNLAAGTITNPNFPLNYADSLGKPLTGGWTFSSDVVLQFDYQTVLYAMRAFGIYASADFRLNADSTFDFEPFIGNKQNNLVFVYGSRGNIADYNAPRLGSNMINDYYGIATDPNGTVLHAEQTDEPSKQKYGLMEGAVAFSDVKDQNALNSRLAEDLYLVKDPADSPLNLIMNEKAYPLGQYDIGDIIHVKIIDGAINYDAPKRIIGISVSLHNTGREMITVQTNTPKQKDLTA
jgi:hypothetical protein